MKLRVLSLFLALLSWTATSHAQRAEPSGAPPSTPTAPAVPTAGVPAASAKPAPRPSVAPAAELDRSTPRQTVNGLLRWVKAGDLTRGAQYLDLRGMRWGAQTPGEAAKQLADLLTLQIWIYPDSLSDVPEGNLEDGADVERIGNVSAAGLDVPISLTRLRRGDKSVWLFSEQTVASLPELREALGAPSWIEPLVPQSIAGTQLGGLWAWQWLGLVLSLVVGYPLGHLAAHGIFKLLLRIARRTQARWDDAALEASRVSARVAIGLATFAGLTQSIGLPGRIADMLRTWTAIPVILATGWAVSRAVHAVIDVVLAGASGEKELETRSVRTHLVILRRLTTGSIVLVTVAVALTRFTVVRDIGISLLASAGVAGVALGFAAQKSLGAVVAGVQLSLTQPVRLGDTVVWQGQWGYIEEITITWIRMKLADERRLIVPVDKFLTEPFENWSMPGTELVGVVEIPVDPTVPIENLREEWTRLANEHPAHDGRECSVVLLDVNERAALVRCRASTSRMLDAFAMRCALREDMLRYLRELEDGRYLARHRLQNVAAPAEAA